MKSRSWLTGSRCSGWLPVATEKVSDLSEDDMARLMVGRELTTLFPPRRPSQKEVPVLEVRVISCPKYVHNASFHSIGEVLGFAGLIGAGAPNVECVVGLRRRSGDGDLRPAPIGTLLRNAIKQQIVYLSEDRKGKGLFTSMPLAPTSPSYPCKITSESVS